MYDIQLDDTGDIKITDDGDILLVDDILQNVLIRLKWFKDEWRLGPGLGFPYFEDVLKKNINIELVESLLRDEIMNVDGIIDANVTELIIDNQNRLLSIRFDFQTCQKIYRKEIELRG